QVVQMEYTQDSRQLSRHHCLHVSGLLFLNLLFDSFLLGLSFLPFLSSFKLFEYFILTIFLLNILLLVYGGFNICFFLYIIFFFFLLFFFFIIFLFFFYIY